jgi:PAS domain S-box-containing protein
MADTKIPEDAKKKLDTLYESYSVVAEDTYVFLCDMKYSYSRWSKALVEHFGLPSEYMYDAGLIWEEHIHPDDRKAYRDGIEEIFSGKAPGHDMQYRARRPDGSYDVCTCRGMVLSTPDGTPDFFCGIIRNHSEKSLIDPVTGLRNQYGFFSDLRGYIKDKTPIMIGMAGIAKLSEVNEVYGYEAGNRVLQHIGRYLLDNVTTRECTYRLDGSRFAIISTKRTASELEDLYELLRAYLRKGIQLDGIDIVLELNAGLLKLDDFNVDYQTVYSCLNLAYQESKHNSHGDLVAFRNRLTDDNKKRIEKLHAIRSSITKDFSGFYLVYQPVVDAGSEQVIGAEALLRWKNDEYGNVFPDEFIPFLETDPLFPELGEWILITALKAAQQLSEYVPGFEINVNLSYAQLEKTNFTSVVRNALVNTGFNSAQLCLEITERCRLLDLELLSNVIISLRSGGIRIALDDFGTGFSSVGLVKNVPFDTIKIDRSFVQQIETDARAEALLNTFTNLAGIYGADVCVEGIETPGMRDIVKSYGIHSFQGYYYSKPITIEDFLDKVKNGANCFAKK